MIYIAMYTVLCIVKMPILILSHYLYVINCIIYLDGYVY